jgi:predicted transcriptional regulator
MARLAMGELEAAVMEALWDRGGWLTPGEVLEVLAEQRPISYTTVMTILVRLWRKERLVRQPAGRAFAYRPKQNREEHAASRMADILTALKNRPAALSHFVAGLTPGDQKQLQRLLNEHKREAGR